MNLARRRLGASAEVLVRTSSCRMGMRSYMTWNEVPAAPLDPILGVNQKFQADTSAEKVNVSIGAYRTDEGKPMVLSCVKKAEALLLEQSDLNKEYLPQRGDATYVQLCQKMLFGEKASAARRLAPLHSQ